jgi:hypothetical protein
MLPVVDSAPRTRLEAFDDHLPCFRLLLHGVCMSLGSSSSNSPPLFAPPRTNAQFETISKACRKTALSSGTFFGDKQALRQLREAHAVKNGLVHGAQEHSGAEGLPVGRGDVESGYGRWKPSAYGADSGGGASEPGPSWANSGSGAAGHGPSWADSGSGAAGPSWADSGSGGSACGVPGADSGSGASACGVPGADSGSGASACGVPGADSGSFWVQDHFSTSPKTPKQLKEAAWAARRGRGRGRGRRTPWWGEVELLRPRDTHHVPHHVGSYFRSWVDPALL